MAKIKKLELDKIEVLRLIERAPQPKLTAKDKKKLIKMVQASLEI